jgi:hypothetical protein
VSGLGAGFENEPLEKLVFGGHGTPRSPTPEEVKPGRVETERVTAEDCLKIGGDDFLVRETFTGLGKVFMALDRLTEGGLTLVTRGVDLFCLALEEALGMRAETDGAERVMTEPTASPQQLMFFCRTCPISGVNRMKDKVIDLAIFEVRFICMLSIFAYIHLARKYFFYFSTQRNERPRGM